MSERSDAGVDLVGSRVGLDPGVGFVTSHRRPLQGDLVGVMHEAIEYGVAEGGIADDVMPVVDGDLAGDECRAPAVAVFEHIEEVTTLGVPLGAPFRSRRTRRAGYAVGGSGTWDTNRRPW